MSWENNQINAYPNIILHDCRINKIVVNGDDVILTFSNLGFFKRESALDSYFRTKGSEIIISDLDFDDVTIKKVETVKMEEEFYQVSNDVSFDSFVVKINSGEWNLDIIEEYYATGSAIFKVMAGEHNKRDWYYIKLYFKELEYLWNDIDYEKPF